MPSPDPGYSIAEQVFERSRMAEVCEVLAAANLHRTKAGARHVLWVQAVRDLATEFQLVNLARTFINGHPTPFRATLFDKSAASNWLVTWHQDTVLPVTRKVDDAQWGPWTVKGGVLHANAPD